MVETRFHHREFRAGWPRRLALSGDSWRKDAEALVARRALEGSNLQRVITPTLYRLHFLPSSSEKGFCLELSRNKIHYLLQWSSDPFGQLLFCFVVFLFGNHAACRILVPWPGIKAGTSAVEAWSLDPWTKDSGKFLDTAFNTHKHIYIF